ncbi:uncharacterized protein MELLADRAFT_105823 [Melampsora larici-populina 98AG31]|uniref:Rhodanese domain-containing protein n=1 Tax=Melampsora larici-populina (strain 98AG31 / pathotype 3-4-7) TaxID=747676 RepID=F4RJG3_MELLP|nr:uncharacterized protein MELLADRAFT_105823 [Melampsora larici-populina 98AG31]EGG07305.1 hypothetical protein MELLADRAFT_105823 [Melampsora larici-populina 98AG31]
MFTSRSITTPFRQLSSIKPLTKSSTLQSGFRISKPRTFSRDMMNVRTFMSTNCIYQSESKDQSSIINYRELKPLTLTPSDDVLLIDVREIEEVVQGNIPSSVNLPLSSLEKSLELHSDEFIKFNGFPKPNSNQKIIFYCRSGHRSHTAMEIAKLKGFKNVKNYKGSWSIVLVNAIQGYVPAMCLSYEVLSVHFSLLPLCYGLPHKPPTAQ